MRTRIKDIYLMKKFIIIACALLGLNVMPSYADGLFVDPLQLAKTQKSHELIGLSEVHNMGYTGKGQVIVVIDDGVVLSNPVFKDRVVDGYCTSKVTCGSYYLKSGIEAGAAHIPPGYEWVPGHGTLVSSIALGNKVGSFPGGIAPDAKLISINNNNGNHEGILLALDWILSIKDKYNIAAVNGSFGFSAGGDRNNSDYCPKVTDITKRLKALRDSNIPFIAAAGNSGGYTTVMFPACDPNTIAIGASDEKGNIESYSDISKEVSVLAPAQVLGANSDGRGYSIGGGTSSAAPVTAGAVAILKQANPKLTFDEIKKALMSSNATVNDLVYSNLPLLNIKSSLNAVLSNKYSPKNVERSSGQIVSNSLNYELDKLKSEISSLKTELAATKAQNEKKQSNENDLTNQINDLKRVNSELVDKQNTLTTELQLVKQQNTNILKKVKVICSSKSRSALCKSLGL